MGRKIKNDDVDDKTKARRERERINQARCVEKKRKQADTYDKEISKAKTKVDADIKKFESLSNVTTDLLKLLGGANLTSADRVLVTNVQSRMDEMKAKTRYYQERAETLAGTKETSPPPVASTSNQASQEEPVAVPE